MTTFLSDANFCKLLWPSVVDAWAKRYNMEKPKVYFIKLGNKRFNTKNFDSYEAARKYVRKLITKRFGKYQDNIGAVGFSIDSK